MTGPLDLKTKAAELPDAPGVYLMKDERGRIIYVGKAKSLHHRVTTYFQEGGLTFRAAGLAPRIHDFETLRTDTEKEAFLLENSLIKRHRPRYNVYLRDDKTYPYIRLDVSAPFPRLEVVRRTKPDGAAYFGPFSSASSMRQTLRLVQRLFPLRQCRRDDIAAVERPCLNHQLGRCSAPCAGLISPEDYRALVDEVVLFFQGRNQTLTKSLEEKMREAARRLDFETAGRYRDRLRAVTRTLEQQKMVLIDARDLDVIGLARERGQSQAALLFIRRGVLLGHRNVPLGATEAPDEEAAASLLGQYYGQDHLVPDEILVPVALEDAALLEEWLSQKKGRKVELHHPVRGPKRRLVELAETNAGAALAERLRSAELGLEAQTDLMHRLNLPAPPRRIEAFDLSTHQGDTPVGAMVVLEERTWCKADYRRFRIQSASGRDDYAMMYEVLRRRLTKDDLPLPDLLLLDGGRGQLAMAQAVIRDLGLAETPPLAALAKGQEGAPDHVYLPGRKNPVGFKPGAPGLLLLMRVRDEAHRFVISYHRRSRRLKSVRSVLENIPGVGPARRKALLVRFGSIEAIQAASLDELAAAPGMNAGVARAVYSFFHAGA